MDGDCIEYDTRGKISDKKVYINGELKFHVVYGCYIMEDSTLKSVDKLIVFNSHP